MIKIEQKDANRKYDFIILGNCIEPLRKTLKVIIFIIILLAPNILKIKCIINLFQGITYSKPKISSSLKKQFNSKQKKIIVDKTKVVNCKSERIILAMNTEKPAGSIDPETFEFPIRRQTYLVGEKENLPNYEANMFNHDTIVSIPDYSSKRPDKKLQDQMFNFHFNIQNQNSNIMTDDSLDDSLMKMVKNKSPFKDFYLTPLRNNENIQNILSPFSNTKKYKSFDTSDENLAPVLFDTSPFKPIDASTAAKICTLEEKKPTRVSVNLCNKFKELPENELTKVNTTFVTDTKNSKSSTSFTEVEQSIDFKQNHELITTHKSNDMKNLIVILKC